MGKGDYGLEQVRPSKYSYNVSQENGENPLDDNAE